MTHSRVGLVMVLTLTSQILGAANALLLHLLGLATADTYAIASQLGLTSFTGVVAGVVYNLAIGRPQFRHWTIWSLVAVGASLIITVGQFGLLAASGYFRTHDATFVALVLGFFGIGGALIGVAGITGVRRACLGSPGLFAAVTIAPNAGMLAGTVIGSFTHSPLAPAFGWLLGSVGVAVVATVRREHGIAMTAAPEMAQDSVDQEYAQHIAGLLLGVLASTVIPLFYVAAIAQLPPGSVYWATLTSRIINAGISLLVSSVLLVRYNWHTHHRSMGPFVFVLSLGFPTLAAFAVVDRVLDIWPPIVAEIAIVIGWAASLVAAVVINREVNARRLGRMILIKTTADAVLAAVAAALLFGHPSVPGYFAAFAVSQGVTTTVGAIALSDRRLAMAGLAGIVCAFWALIAFS